MRYQRLMFFLLILIVFADILSKIGDVIGYSGNSLTSFTLVARYIVLILLLYIAKRSRWSVDIPQIIVILFKMFLIWNIFTIAHGAISAVDYWDWKFLLFSSILFFLIPLAMLIGKNPQLVRLIFKDYLKYIFTLGFVLIPLSFLTSRELYSRIMIPISIFILFIPYLKPKWRKLILLVAVVSIVVVIDFRTNILKIVFSLLFLMLFYFRRFISRGWIKFLHIIIFLAPIVLLTLGITGEFNIFSTASKNNSYTIKSQKGDLGDENLAADTRTFLYVEVFASLLKDGTLITGEGATAKYKSDYFDSYGDHRGRYASEVGFLNIILYSGIIGLVIYFLILFVSSFYAIYYSNNLLCKMLGLLIATRWLLFFVEEFTNFDLNTLFTWLIIGLVSSKTFRSMSDKDLKLFFSI